MHSKFQNYLFSICSVLLILSAIGWIFDHEAKVIHYIYAVSGAGVAVYFLTTPYKGDNLRMKRLNIQQAIAALLLPVSSFLMFEGLNEWFVCLFVSAILFVYVIYSREHEEKKEKKQD